MPTTTPHTNNSFCECIPGTYGGMFVYSCLFVSCLLMFFFVSFQKTTNLYFLKKGDCKSSFCSGVSLITKPTATFSDHFGTRDYQNNANCIWLIKPAGANSQSSVSLSKRDIEREI